MTLQKMRNNLEIKMLMVTCKYFSVESLNPVVPHVETDHRLKTIESPHPDLGEKVIRELQFPQGCLTPELVSTKTSQRVPEMMG